MENLKIGIGVMLIALIGFSACAKEEIIEEDIVIQPTKTELITGSYAVTLAVINGDTLSASEQWMDQTFVINGDGTGAQILYVSYGSDAYEFTKPLEWEFGTNEETWSMRTKELDDNGEPVEEWGDWIPFNILKLTEQEFWYGLNHPEFSMEFHLDKQ